ncbi:hypothetical protein LTR56_025501 [Elasticomyces elasticus]|nr:hypothetical protein LTR56_025501 [Elasticomyces elasticus]KAK3619397.1 hypothetical protein LTR22_025995 [Elasticomyces elasticus]KAK4907681.1 hypothetical protein LTR49_023334 [Elasticomyces elasticus]KAK5747895.1 hypothetical protein LTS12_022041 [Elasticomyces elasticus]
MLDFNANDGVFRTIDEHIAKVQAFKKAYPEFRVTVINATADVDIECRHAVVWATMGGGGMSKERLLNRENVAQLHFQFNTNRQAWLCSKIVGIWGYGGREMFPD